MYVRESNVLCAVFGYYVRYYTPFSQFDVHCFLSRGLFYLFEGSVYFRKEMLGLYGKKSMDSNYNNNKTTNKKKRKKKTEKHLHHHHQHQTPCQRGSCLFAFFPGSYLICYTGTGQSTVGREDEIAMGLHPLRNEVSVTRIVFHAGCCSEVLASGAKK